MESCEQFSQLCDTEHPRIDLTEVASTVLDPSSECDVADAQSRDEGFAGSDPESACSGPSRKCVQFVRGGTLPDTSNACESVYTRPMQLSLPKFPAFAPLSEAGQVQLTGFFYQSSQHSRASSPHEGAGPGVPTLLPLANSLRSSGGSPGTSSTPSSCASSESRSALTEGEGEVLEGQKSTAKKGNKFRHNEHGNICMLCGASEYSYAESTIAGYWNTLPLRQCGYCEIWCCSGARQFGVRGCSTFENGKVWCTRCQDIWC